MINFKMPNWLKATETVAMRIGIEGLSPLASQLELGSQYIVSVENCQARQALLCSTVRSVISSGGDCVILTPDPEKLSEKLLLSAVPQQKIQSLLLLKQLPDTLQQMKSFGCERLLIELEDIGVRSGSLLIVEAADDLLNWQDADHFKANAQRFRRWFHSWQISGLLLIEPSSAQLPKDIARRLDLFSGVAEFHKDLGCFRWLIQHWHSAQGTLEDSDYEIHFSGTDCGLKLVDSELDNAAFGGDPLVYFTAESIAGDESVPEDWLRLSNYQEVVAIGVALSQATVILDYRQPSSFPLLAQTVHQLRFIAGRQMRIVIRERGGQLRYSQELLLTRLGATQIVYMEFGFSRLLRAVEASRGLRFTGDIEEDFNHALAAAMPSEECGYLPAGRFCEVVKSSLQKTEAIDMHHVLVRLDILPQMAHVDVLLNCQPRRANDVVTADESHVYIFLFACREADIDSALSRIVIEPLEQLFTGQSYWSGRRNIMDILDRLHERYKLIGLADFSLLLPASSGRETVTASAAGSVSSTNPKSRHLTESANAGAAERAAVPKPRTVIQHSLKLRSKS